MRLHLFFSHKLTKAQIEDAKNSFGIKEFIYLPDDLQDRFSNVPPSLDDLSEYVKPFIKYLLSNAEKGDYILLQGDFGLVYRLVEVSKDIGLIPVYSTTKRVVKEKNEKNKNVKISEFVHVKFRKY